jgi:hypothetical protein
MAIKFPSPGPETGRVQIPNQEEVIDDANRNQAQIPNPVRQEPLNLTTNVEKLTGENFGVWKF